MGWSLAYSVLCKFFNGFFNDVNCISILALQHVMIPSIHWACIRRPADCLRQLAVPELRPPAQRAEGCT